MKKWIPFIIGGRLHSPASDAAERLAAIMRHNLGVLRDPAALPQTQDAAEVELEALRVELMEAHETVATLIEELNHSRMWAEYLEEQLADYEDGKVVPLRRGQHTP